MRFKLINFYPVINICNGASPSVREATLALNNKKYCGAVVLNVAQAFDKV